MIKQKKGKRRKEEEGDKPTTADHLEGKSRGGGMLYSTSLDTNSCSRLEATKFKSRDELSFDFLGRLEEEKKEGAL